MLTAFSLRLLVRLYAQDHVEDHDIEVRQAGAVLVNVVAQLIATKTVVLESFYSSRYRVP